MKILERIVLAAVIIIALQVLIFLGDRYSPETTLFHQRFLLCMQLMVILWLTIMLLLHLFRLHRSWFARFLPVILALLVLAADIVYSRMLQMPENIPAFALPSFRNFYNNYERNAMEYEPCTVYDSVWQYRLMPGLRFTFGNIEYENQYSINSASFRDDEESLFGPSVVCVGSSYTLGCGVDQQQSFPELLANKTQLPVANCAIPADGTLKELRQLARVDTSVMSHLVIQYNSADSLENRLFAAGLQIRRSPQDYALLQKQYVWAKEFFPGKYSIGITYDALRSLVKNLVNGNGNPQTNAVGINEQARNFLNVLSQLNISPVVKIIIINPERQEKTNESFIAAVDSILNDPEFAHLRSSVTAMNLSNTLSNEDYFKLDKHLNASGHAKVADIIAAAIKKTSAENKKE